MYRLFYEVVTDSERDRVRCLKAVESVDLKSFTPVLNDDGHDVIFNGFSGVSGCSVMLDEFETDLAKRYKLCGMLRMGENEDKSPHSDQSVTLSYSPDGIHWTPDKSNPVNNNTSDTLNKLFYNPQTGEYGVILRSAYVDRRISLKTSKDLKNWSEPELIIHPSPSYNNGYSQTIPILYLNGRTQSLRISSENS